MSNTFTHADELIQASNFFDGGSNTAVLTPDSDPSTQSPWTRSNGSSASDYSTSFLADTPWCAKGDDLDDDEAYFLDDDDDDDDDAEDDYDEEDDDDYDEDGPDEDSDKEDDDEEL